MGYVIKSAFWLGLVYSAMPLGQEVKVALPGAPAVDYSLCASADKALADKLGAEATPYRGAATLGCAALVAAWNAPPAEPARPAKADTLTAADRKPPWRGPRPTKSS